ncbi:MAG: hypothetical protein HOO91_04760 [Bacteroidales bacterium]|nr:hypothetical protein [Bacteroidales bacterium]
MVDNYIQRIDINTWILRIEGVTILLDPWIVGSASMLPVLKLVHVDGIPIKIDELPKIDIIVITHKDVDHCHLPTLNLLDKSIRIICPEDVMKIVKKAGYINTSVLNYWETIEIIHPHLTITAVPAEHPKLVKQNAYVFNYNNKAIYFTGDTNYVKAFKDIGEKFNIEYALIPIIGVKISMIGQIVMGPEDAIKCLEYLKSKNIIPTSYGNVKLSGFLKPFMQTIGCADEFKSLLKEKLPNVKLLLPERLEKLILFE